jgi:hypothetical protein
MASCPPPDLSDPVGTFMARVLADPSAQARLAVPYAMEAYVPLAIEIARGYGIALSAAEFDKYLHADALGLGLGRFGPAPVMLDRWPGEGWVPVRSVPGDAAPAFDWAWFGDTAFSGSFFEDTVRRATVLPFNRMFRTRTSLSALVGDSSDYDTIAPNGFVFHMSRCGSTLAARMLMAVPAHLVASEPEPLDAVVQWATLSGAPRDEQIAAMRAIVAALGRKRSADQHRFFIKLDAWHTLALPLFRAAFPDVPWIFLYRDPAEVIVSQMTQPGLHFVPGMLPPGLIGEDFAEAATLPDYGARVLARLCRAVVDHWPLGGGLLVDYPTLGDAMTTTVPGHFGLSLAPAEIDAMTAATAVDAKRPTEAFEADGARKFRAVTPEIQIASEMHLAPVIAALDSLRMDGI